MSRPLVSQPRRERAAAAVEMALVLPLLLLMLGGIVDFGRFFYTQNLVVNAAREGARTRALGYSTTDADTRVAQSLLGYQGSAFTTTYSLVQGSTNVVTANGACPTSAPDPLDRQRVKVSVTGFTYIVLGPASRLFGGALTPPTPVGTAEVRCGG